ncbi:MAG TPA: hypothetical protein VMR51_01190 [Patescibacteria group bacterium]|nr:hypothetical protein [Patescibacteria group bacterium]
MPKLNPKIRQIPKPKPMLNTYMQVPYLLGGAVITATIIVGGVFAYKHFNKPTPVQNTTNTQTTVTPISSYVGTYTGATHVAQGLADVTITVSGSTITGKGTFNGTVYGYAVSAPISLSGTVAASGAVSIGVSGSGMVEGQSYTAGGSAIGQITGNTMTCTYSVVAAGESFNGNITLTK